MDLALSLSLIFGAANLGLTVGFLVSAWPARRRVDLPPPRRIELPLSGRRQCALPADLWAEIERRPLDDR